MPAERSGALWRRVSAVLVIAAVAVSLWLGRSAMLAYGVAAALLILLLAFFGVRKRVYHLDLGRGQAWLQSHIYLGVVAAVVAILHTGFRWDDRMALLALLLMGIVVVSGIVGAVLYRTVPPMLTRVESSATGEEISKQVDQMTRTMERTAAARSGAFQSVCEELLRAARASDRNAADWTALLARVPPSEQAALREMLIVSRQRKELLAKLRTQQRYRNMLRAWLLVHVPATVALLVALTAHVVTAFYYGGVR
jgi:hypothetical protein